MVFVPPSTAPGDHITYPPDGQVHQTIPALRREFLDNRPPLSDVTLEVFAGLELSSTGPPRGSRSISSPQEEDFVVVAPPSGQTGQVLVAVSNSTNTSIMESYMGSITSNSTYQMAIGGAGVAILGYYVRSPST